MIPNETTPFDLVLDAHSGRMSEHLLRVEALREIQRARGWTDSDLARHCGRSPQQVRAWYRQPGAKGARNIVEKLARDIEEALGLTPFSLDMSPLSRAYTTTAFSAGESIPAGGISTTYTGGSHSIARLPTATRGAREVPVVLWARLTEMLDQDNARLRDRAVHLETFASVSSRGKFVQVADDSMSPSFTPGDHILLDPDEAPTAGDVVVVQLPSGEVLLRSFAPRTATSWEGIAANPAYLPVSSETHGARVLAVVVEHRRYRQRR